MRRSTVGRARRQQIARESRQFYAMAITQGLTVDQIQGELLSRFPGELAPGEARMHAMGWTTRTVRDGLLALAEGEDEPVTGLELIDVSRWLRGEVRPTAWLPRLCRLFRCHQAHLGWPPQGNEVPVDFTPEAAARPASRDQGSSQLTRPLWLPAPADDARGAAPPGALVAFDDGQPIRVRSTDGEFVTLVLTRRELAEVLEQTDGCLIEKVATLDEAGATGPKRRLPAAERAALAETISRSIEAAWALFHTADALRMTAVGRTQLHLLKVHHAQLDPDVLPAFHSAAYRLLGATCHRRGLYRDALDAHAKAYLAALDGGDAWNMAECRAWQAYGVQALGCFDDALALTESALRLISEHDDPAAVRLRARLLTSAAMNAATIRAEERVSAMLRESELLLDQLPASHEEFDRTAWLESAGVCSLRLGHLEPAVDSLRKALDETPEHWVSRHAFATMGLATALACVREREAALAAAAGLVPRLRDARSQELIEHFRRFLHRDLLGSFPGDGPCLALVAEAEEALSAHA